MPQLQAQNGFAILFTVRNQDGKAPWSVVEDVTFVNNIVRHSGAGINMHGRDDQHPSQQTRRILVGNNLFEDIGGPRWGGGTLLQIINGAANVVIEHNTAFQTGNIITTEGARTKASSFGRTSCRTTSTASPAPAPGREARRSPRSSRTR